MAQGAELRFSYCLQGLDPHAAKGVVTNYHDAIKAAQSFLCNLPTKLDKCEKPRSSAQ